MYASGITQELVDRAVSFHGHLCPGLSIGIRAAAWAIQNFGTAADEEIVAVTETDMCAVDAIQALAGCTFGKGNLIYRARGKVAFSFFRRSDGKSARLVRLFYETPLSAGISALRTRLEDTSLPGLERSQMEADLEAMRQEHIKALLSAPFEELFSIGIPRYAMPAPARLYQTIACEECGEGVMASCLHIRGGRRLCLDCVEKDALPV